MAEGNNAVKRDGEAGGGRGLKLHHLRPAPGSHTPRTRVGRGEGGKGKTAGRGTKGTRARGPVAGGFEGGQMPLHRRGPPAQGVSDPPVPDTHQVGHPRRPPPPYPP